MGVDLQTYRSRIGSFNSRHCLSCGLPSSVTADVADVVSSGILGALFAQCIELLLILLLLAGDVELNPGPHVTERKRGRPTSMTCAVPNCGNKRRTRPDISYFHFPLSWYANIFIKLSLPRYMISDINSSYI